VFETTWKNRPLWAKEASIPNAEVSAVPSDRILRVALLYWREHCLECAPPVCYRQCPLYLARADRKCVRVSYGIYPNRKLRGALPYGADMRFRRWAHIESRFYPRASTLATYRFIDRLSRGLSWTANVISSLLSWVNPTRKIGGALAHYREELLRWSSYRAPQDFDAFLLESYSAESESFNLILHCSNPDGVYFQHAFPVKPGPNFFEIPFADMRFPADACGDRIALFPENDMEVRLVITWCTFVKYATTPADCKTTVHAAPAAQKPMARPPENVGTILPATPAERTKPHGELLPGPAAKVKCVCWDLDNTLWQGVLIEDGPDNVVWRQPMLDLIRALDERGVIQTIVSKNTYDQAWPVIEKAGLEDYFLCPAINWNPKSANIRKIADRLNIGVDTFALIDDSPFEREEVRSTLPMVRTFDDSEVATLLNYDEFKVPISPESKNRRLSYLAEFERQHVKHQSGVDSTEFLRSCQMVVEVFCPADTAEVQRCWELCQRSNQLNLSTRRYTPEEFKTLLVSPKMRCLAFKCRDRFGDYGIVGFCSVDDEPNADGPELVDFVISCRVARKHIEQTLIQWLGKEAYDRGKSSLRARFVKTAKSGPMSDVLASLPFTITPLDETTVLYEMLLHDELVVDDLLTLIVNV